MTIQEAIDYINAHTWSQWKLGLSRTRDLLALMGNPQKKLRFVHVAGSNGKGSTCAMLEQILREAGYVTGLYPSPYIEDFRERIQVCGDYITEEALCRITAKVKELADSMEDHPTQFELITAIGMEYFAEKNCDIVVLEVGLGGIFDSTNIIDAPEVAVITNIGLEHTEYLGDTLGEIASNKCGIIKSGSDVVCYENLPEVMKVVRRTCEEKGCTLHIARQDRVVPVERSLYGQTFRFLNKRQGIDGQEKNSKGKNSQEKYGREKDSQEGTLLRLALLGEYQLHNAATVLTIVEALRGRGFPIPEEAVKRGMAEVKWPARFEVLSHNPLFILDGGHNPQCAAALAESIRTYLPKAEGSSPGKGRIVFLMGMLADKDYRTVIDIISPFAAAFVCLTPESPRALSAEDLAEELRGRGFAAYPCKNAREGIEEALKAAEKIAVTVSGPVSWSESAGKPAEGWTPEPAAEPEHADNPNEDCAHEQFMGGAPGNRIHGETESLPVIAFGSLYMAGEVRSAFPGSKKDHIISRKKEQRKEAAARRRSLSPEQREEKSRTVCRLLEDMPQLKNAGTVFSYAATPDEINVDEINRYLEERGKRVCYPICEKDGIMEAVIPGSDHSQAWQKGTFGIREPVKEKALPVAPEEINAVIVPCLVFDRRGRRCGRGAGYYDRYLAKLSPDVPKILVAFDCQEASAVAEEETDVRMDFAVTESGILAIG